MTKIILDEELLARFQYFRQPVEFCDPSGRVIGHGLPTPESAPSETWVPEFSEAELQALESSTEPRYSTAEVLEYLARL